jgi:hypothetical protein
MIDPKMKARITRMAQVTWETIWEDAEAICPIETVDEAVEITADADQMLAHGCDPEAYKEWDTLPLDEKLAVVKEALRDYF